MVSAHDVDGVMVGQKSGFIIILKISYNGLLMVDTLYTYVHMSSYAYIQKRKPGCLSMMYPSTIQALHVLLSLSPIIPHQPY